MSGDVTYQALERLTHMPDRPDPQGDVIAGQKYYDINFTGGTIGADVVFEGGNFYTPGAAGTILTSTGISAEFQVLNVGNDPVGILWPAYIYPANLMGGVQGLDMFNDFMDDMADNPLVPVVAVVTPAPVGTDSNYTSIISRLIAAGATTIAYTYTDYTNRAIATVKADIDGLVTNYPAIQGIFLDNMTSIYFEPPGSVAYYQELYTYITVTKGLSLVVGNPGANVPEQYYDGTMADIIVCHENTNGVWPTAQEASNSGFGTRSQRSTIVADRPFDTEQFAIMTTSSGWVYLTDAPPNDAYGMIPTYLSSEFANLQGLAEAAAVQGVLSQNNGGLGIANPTENSVLLGGGTGAVQEVAPGETYNVLTSDGETWESSPPLGIGTFLPVGFLIPAYIYPSGGGLAFFTALTTQMASNPNVPVTVILTPAPSGGADANYTSIISTLQTAGAKVILVADTNYAATSIGTVEANIAILVGYYPTIDGIFVDRMSNDSADIAYYQSLKTYINGTSGLDLVVGNTGTTTPSGFFDGSVADIIVVISTDTIWPTAAQANNGDIGTKAQHASIVSQITFDADQFAILTKYSGWVYTTNQTYASSSAPAALATMFSTLQGLDLSAALEMPALSFACNPHNYEANMEALSGGAARQSVRINTAADALEFFTPVAVTAETTGAGSALLGANSPAITLTDPFKWLTIKTADGSTAYVPCWK